MNIKKYPTIMVGYFFPYIIVSTRRLKTAFPFTIPVYHSYPLCQHEAVENRLPIHYVDQYIGLKPSDFTNFLVTSPTRSVECDVSSFRIFPFGLRSHCLRST